MKPVLFLLFLIGVSHASLDFGELFSKEHVKEFFKHATSLTKMDQKEATSPSADMSEYVDKIMPNIDRFVGRQFEPFKMPDISLQLIKHFGIINHLGPMANLTNGDLREVYTLRRVEPAILKYFHTNTSLVLSIPVALEALMVKYDYEIKELTLGSSGAVIVQITGVKMLLTFVIDLENYRIDLAGFDYIKMRKIKTDMDCLGNISLTDWLCSSMGSAVANLFPSIVTGIIRNIVYGASDKILGSVNEALAKLLHPST